MLKLYTVQYLKDSLHIEKIHKYTGIVVCTKIKVNSNLTLDEGDQNKDEWKKELGGEAKECYDDVAGQGKQASRF